MIMTSLKNYLAVFGILATSFSTFAQTAPKKYIDPANMDLSVKPGNDFYQYASGTWIKKNPVPAKETRWGSFNELREFNSQAVKGLVQNAAADKSALAGSVTKRVGDFYAAAMDSITIEKLGYTPIKGDLEKINQINTVQGLLDHIAYMRTSGIGGPLFGFGVGQDRKNVTKYVVNISQGGTTLGDRDYYLKDDPQSQKIRAAYNTYMVKLFTLTGSTDAMAKQKASTVFNLEKALAEAQMSRIEMRDQYKTYNKLTVTEFNKITPNINWNTLMPKFKITGQDTVLVNSLAFFKSLDGMLSSVPLEDWKTYLSWNILKGSANNLSSPFVKASFAFTQAQSGQKVQTPRWQRMSSLTDGTIGELLGQLYVAKYFKPDAKVRMDAMIVNLRKAFEIRINGLEWMSDATKKRALAKLQAFTPKVGYTTKWRTYDGLAITRSTYFQNLRNAGIWAYNENIKQLGKPVDRTRFGMTPPTVNASYS
ncbi:MAG: M13 family metallopeptidase, partial [Pedobacter sp.]|nr:M13 family metallopeptidase [Pedobacter sp.]